MATIDYKQLSTPEANLIELLSAQNQDGTYSAKLMGSEPFSVLAAKTIYNTYNDIESNMAADVEGPASSTDNALARFDGTTGKLIQNSNAILTDAGALSLASNLTVSGTGNIVNTNPTLTFKRTDSLSPLARLNFSGSDNIVKWQIATNLAVGGAVFEVNKGDGSNNYLKIDNSGNTTLAGNLTVSGTGTSSFAGPVTGTSSTNGYQWTLTGSGVGGPFLALDATNATVANRYSGLTLYSGGTFQWGLQLRAGDGKFHIYDGVRTVSALTVDVGPLSGVAGTTTVGGNLTVSGRTYITGARSDNSNLSLNLSATIPGISINCTSAGASRNFAITNNYSGAGLLEILGSSAALGLPNNPLLAVTATGNLLIGTTTDTGEKLQVNGTGYFAGALLQVGNSSNDALYRVSASNGKSSDFGDDTTGGFVRANNSQSLRFITAGNIVLTLDSSANATFAGTIKPQQAATASAPTYVKGTIYFDTTLNKLRVGGATGWETVTSV